MNIDCIGAGPGGLYFAILAKLRNPAGRVRVFERSSRDRSPGWGIVLDQELRGQLLEADPTSAGAINRELFRWDNIQILVRERCISSQGHPFGAIGRQRLQAILMERAIELGVQVHFDRVVSASQLEDADLILACDGAGSGTRESHREVFLPRITLGRNFYIWCGTTRQLGNFTFSMHDSPNGWIWAQAYQFDPQRSTFIAECDPASMAHHQLGSRPWQEAVALLESVYAPALRGSPLIVGAGADGRLDWRRFPHIHCEHWHHANIVLLGDAAHTAHYSLGSGTKLALEDGITLAQQVFGSEESLGSRLDAYQSIRQARVRDIQELANNSNHWFERLVDFADLSAEQFACALLMRTRYRGEPTPPQQYDKMVQLARTSMAKASPEKRLRHVLQPLDLHVESQPCV